ncbi:hypothetical protein WN48_09233 [Eufriesea mexicana]|uniref:Uncharacterized protein n=1 Tax=Eufriesea mexicana TaxID=516756 RepID=A0A310S3V1_9HYME|nr:hypothetical protein WN48_09233 [Eufriesea mexicana]
MALADLRDNEQVRFKKDRRDSFNQIKQTSAKRRSLLETQTNNRIKQTSVKRRSLLETQTNGVVP